MDKTNLLAQLKAMAEKNDFAILTTQTEEGYPFAYTLGMSAMGMPDIVLFTPFPSSLTASIVNRVCEYWKVNGVCIGEIPDIAEFSSGEAMSGHILAVDVEAVVADYAFMLDDYYLQYPEQVGEAGIDIVQLIWPDENGVFPTDAGFNTGFFQPVLSPKQTH